MKNNQYKLFQYFLISFFCLPLFSFASGKNKPVSRPKLVVAIVVDQMRFDYLYRYWDRYQQNGFKRLMEQGANCTNAHYNYVPTYTGPGHASIFTGTTPSMHGIVGNNWWNSKTKKMDYCTADAEANTVGATTKLVGKMSPKNILTTTIMDELKLACNFNCKTIGIALKDRGAILPAGHTANYAFWFDGQSGNWVTSDFYTKALPNWLTEFNKLQLAKQYLQMDWNTYYPINTYLQSTADSVPYESKFKKERAPVFPHRLAQLTDSIIKSDLIRATPYGNTITRLLAQACIDKELLGQQMLTDFLSISFSSPDYIGHQFGPNSIEVEDNYIRLDMEIGELLNYLDKKIGKENVLVFLTADHGAAIVPSFAKENKIPGGVTYSAFFYDSLNVFLSKEFKAINLIENYENQNIFINVNRANELGIDIKMLQNKIIDYCKRQPGVYQVYVTNDLIKGAYLTPMANQIANGIWPERSGQLVVEYYPGWFEDMTKGTSHGTYYSYDTHVPLLFWGWKIKPIETNTAIQITDIAPTICNWLHIMEPNGSTGHVISFK
jgi:predicted AlkP superfamily pyrophosphatase or phosphodiesterase